MCTEILKGSVERCIEDEVHQYTDNEEPHVAREMSIFHLHPVSIESPNHGEVETVYQEGNVTGPDLSGPPGLEHFEAKRLSTPPTHQHQ